MMKTLTTYRLGSAPMINAPSILAWAMNGYRFPRDRKSLLKVFVEGWGNDECSPSPEVFDKLLMGEIPYTVEDGAVVFVA